VEVALAGIDGERLQTAAMICARGNLSKLHDAVALASTDWRDLLVRAELADDDWQTKLDTALAVFPCPCCGSLTLDEEPPGTFYICPVCWWEDDNVQAADPNYRGGANKESLNEVRALFLAWRAAGFPADRWRRPPEADEVGAL
jgi:hypothetical protein